jgi:hypothetical protein
MAKSSFLVLKKGSGYEQAGLDYMRKVVGG